MVCHILLQAIDDLILFVAEFDDLVHDAHVNLLVNLSICNVCLRTENRSLQDSLPRRSLSLILRLHLRLFLLCQFFLAVVSVGKFMINASVEVLVVAHLVVAIEVAHLETKLYHAFLLLHQRSAYLNEFLLLRNAVLPRIEGAEHDFFGLAVLLQALCRSCPDGMLSELRVQVTLASVLHLFEQALAHDVSELLPHQVLLLLVENVQSLIDAVEPRMQEDLFCGKALFAINFKHVLHKIDALARQLLVTVLNLLLVKLGRQVLEPRGGQRHVTV